MEGKMRNVGVPVVLCQIPSWMSYWVRFVIMVILCSVANGERGNGPAEKHY